MVGEVLAHKLDFMNLGSVLLRVPITVAARSEA
jgi:hypothetical protein